MRPAFTLVEVIVTLVVMGIALAVVGPSLIFPRPNPALSDALTSARRTALNRAGVVTLIVAADGKWSMGESTGSIAPTGSGDLEFLISPIGVCTLTHGHLRTGSTLDPLQCAVTVPPSDSR